MIFRSVDDYNLKIELQKKMEAQKAEMQRLEYQQRELFLVQKIQEEQVGEPSGKGHYILQMIFDWSLLNYVVYYFPEDAVSKAPYVYFSVHSFTLLEFLYFSCIFLLYLWEHNYFSYS